jgi:hypothetical protein
MYTMIAWVFMSLYFFNDTIGRKTSINTMFPFAHRRLVNKTKRFRVTSPSLPQSSSSSSNVTIHTKSKSLYVSLSNRDIRGRCDIGEVPIKLSKAERACEQDHLCKAFVEVEGMVYLKSCAVPDPIPNQGRTLYVHRQFYSGSVSVVQKAQKELSQSVVQKAQKELSQSNKMVAIPTMRNSTEVQPIHISRGKRRVPCDVPCFWPPKSGGILHTRKIDELGATITMSMEGEEYYPVLKLSNRRKNHFIGSTRFDSEIPMPYYNWPWTLYMEKTPVGDDIWSRNHIQTPHIPFSKVKKAAVFIARNCNSRSKREKLVSSLMNLMTVDSVSSCLHNFNLGGDKSNKGKMMQKYALYFAFENERIDDYITEKLWGTFSAGVLPVYFGAPNIKQHVPDHSIVSVDDFESVDALAKHLTDILSNEALYNSYHEWRYKPLPDWFVRKYNFTHVHSECRLCRWTSAKLRGLSWDAEQQQIIYD